MQNVPNTIKITKSLRYPKQINFSSNFLKNLSKEYTANKNSSSEDVPIPVLNYKEKFIKAINFYLSQL